MKLEDFINLERTVRTLSIDLDYLDKQLDAAEERGDDLAAASLARSWLVQEGLLAHAKEKLDRCRSEAGRSSAEARLAYHVENDTLDLY